MSDATDNAATKAGPGVFEVTDARGRVLTVKRPNVLAQYRLVRTLGADAASNTPYLNMLMPLLYLHKLDGAEVSIGNQREIDLLIQQLDDDGLVALTGAISENFAKQDDEGAVKKP